MTSLTLKCYLKFLISVTILSLSPPSFLTQGYFWTWPSFSLSSKNKVFDFSSVWDHDGEVGTIHCSVRKNAFCSPYIISVTQIYLPTIHLFHLFNRSPYLYVSSPLGWEASQHRNLRKASTSWKLIQQMFLLCSKLPWCKWFQTYYIWTHMEVFKVFCHSLHFSRLRSLKFKNTRSLFRRQRGLPTHTFS